MNGGQHSDLHVQLAVARADLSALTKANVSLRLLAERQREALAGVLRWLPHTDIGLAALHPQQLEAVLIARAVLADEGPA